MVHRIKSREESRARFLITARAAIDVVERRQALVGLSAAYLWETPLPSVEFSSGLELNISLAPVGGGNRSRVSGMRGHRLELPPEHLRERMGLMVTSPSRTWLDCSALVSDQDLLAAGDFCATTGLATAAELEQICRWGRGRRGIRKAKAVLQLVRPGVDSPAESWLRWILVKGGLPEPEINFSVVIRGVHAFRLDLAYVGPRVGVEYDGDWHADTVTHEAARRSLLRQAGWEVLVFHKEDLADPAHVVRVVTAALARSRQGVCVPKRRW